MNQKLQIVILGNLGRFLALKRLARNKKTTKQVKRLWEQEQKKTILYVVDGTIGNILFTTPTNINQITPKKVTPKKVTPKKVISKRRKKRIYTSHYNKPLKRNELLNAIAINTSTVYYIVKRIVINKNIKWFRKSNRYFNRKEYVRICYLE